MVTNPYFIHSILPPYMLEHIAEHGTEAQREKALRRPQTFISVKVFAKTAHWRPRLRWHTTDAVAT